NLPERSETLLIAIRCSGSKLSFAALRRRARCSSVFMLSSRHEASGRAIQPRGNRAATGRGVEDHGQHAAATARYASSCSATKAKTNWRGSSGAEGFRPPAKTLVGNRGTRSVSFLICHPFADNAADYLGGPLGILDLEGDPLV